MQCEVIGGVKLQNLWALICKGASPQLFRPIGAVSFCLIFKIKVQNCHCVHSKLVQLHTFSSQNKSVVLNQTLPHFEKFIFYLNTKIQPIFYALNYLEVDAKEIRLASPEIGYKNSQISPDEVCLGIQMIPKY